MVLGVGNEYAECSIVYECDADEYVNLENLEITERAILIIFLLAFFVIFFFLCERIIKLLLGDSM
jgi:hypothetical protein